MDAQNECPDCGVLPGTLHRPGCDVEQCRLCGGQRLGCGCMFTIDMVVDVPEDRELTEEDLDALMIENDASEVDRFGGALPWTGGWPGNAECRELGWFATHVPGQGWTRCVFDDPGATEDWIRLRMEATWDPAAGRFRLREDA